MSVIKTIAIVCVLLALCAKAIDFTFNLVYNEAEDGKIYDLARMAEMPANWKIPMPNISENHPPRTEDIHVRCPLDADNCSFVINGTRCTRTVIPLIPMSWKISMPNISEDCPPGAENCVSCRDYGWGDGSCIICWDVFSNAIVEIQFLIYWLDLVSVGMGFGLFLPRPSEVLWMLGRAFPPLSPFTRWFLLFPGSVFPPSAAWACWFINLFHLYLAVCALVILYAVYRWRRSG